MLDRVRPSDLLARAGVGTLLLVELLVVAPLALAATGGSLREGVRNPAGTAKATAETQIIADTSGYSTRQSNVSGTGGGAIYGCRSGVGGTANGNEPCLRANNLRNGLAFEFQATRGNVGGLIQFGSNVGKPVDATPFVTNTNGTATVKYLSADRLDGIDSSQLATKIQTSQLAPRSDLAAVDSRITAMAQQETGLASAQAGGQSDILLYNADLVIPTPSLGLRLACESLPDGQLRARILGVGERFSVSGAAGVVIPPDGVAAPLREGAQTPTLVSVDSKPDSANLYTYSYAEQIEDLSQGGFPDRFNLEGTLVVGLRPEDGSCYARATM